MSKKNSKKYSKNVSEEKTNTVYKTDQEEYGLVTKKLGNGRFLVKLQLKKQEVIGRLCGRMKRGRNKRSNWVDEGSVVLVGIRDYQEDKVDIVHVYNSSEVRDLKKSGEYIEESGIQFKIKEESKEEDDCVFDFDDI